MTFSAKKNDGVSPVIGTILLVAITVVLVAIISAVISAVIMGMAGGIGSSYVVGVTVTEDSSAIAGTALITITGGNDASKLEKTLCLQRYRYEFKRPYYCWCAK